MTKADKNEQRMERLLPLLEDARYVMIVMQDHPDPDAIASAAALRALINALGDGQCSMTCGGLVGRSENRLMVEYLGLKLHDYDDLSKRQFDLVAMVDTQPQTGNNALPESEAPDVVIDHHPIQSSTRSATYTDIRQHYGATSTILYEYLTLQDVEISVPLATAMLYGIRSDTQDLGRESTQADIDAYLALYPKVNKRMLSKIEHGPVPDTYFQALAAALGDARIYRDCVLTKLGPIRNPDMVGEVADLLMRREDTLWSLCAGFYENQILFSIRTMDRDADAGPIAAETAGTHGTGGGHNNMAAGQIPLPLNTLTAREQAVRGMEERFLKAVERNDETSRPLVE